MIGNCVRGILTLTLLWWVSTGSRVALVVAFALVIIAIEFHAWSMKKMAIYFLDRHR